MQKIPVSDSTLQELANNFPHGKYHQLCLKLGVATNKAQNRLVKHSNDYEKAVIELLMEWKNQTGGYKKPLIEVLRKSGAGGLVSILG